jgi:23S rRNA (cytosine1962-C5)-methyltransferase
MIQPNPNIHALAQQRTRIKMCGFTREADVLAACAAGADVTHLDAVKQMVSIARESMEASDLHGIRWVVEDALKFVKREQRRGNTYHGIVLDPPAYGIGANGERWQLEQSINELLQDVAKILEPNNHFLILNVFYKNIHCWPKLGSFMIKIF